MIHWTYPNGELTWQAVLLIADVSIIVGFYLLIALGERRRRRRRWARRSTTRIYKGLYR
jgi:hypothetical protein